MPASHQQWIIPFAIQIIPAGLLFVGSLWIRESPRWLFLKGRRAQAMGNLCWIRQLDEADIYITEEVAAIDQALEEQASTIGVGFWKPFQAVARRKTILYRLFLGCMLFFWQNGSGINAINYYSPTIFTSIGVSDADVGWMTGIFGVIKAVMTFVWLLFLVDQLGRRNLLLGGAITGSICMWIIGAYICVVRPEDNPTDHLNGGGIAAIFFFYLWTVCIAETALSTQLTNCAGCLHSHLERNTLGLQLGTYPIPYLRKSQTNRHLGILRSQPPIPRASRDNSQQLAVQLPRLAIHQANVCKDELRRLLLLRGTILPRVLLRLLPDPRNQRYPSRGRRPAVRDQTCLAGTQQAEGAAQGRRRTVPL